MKGSRIVLLRALQMLLLAEGSTAFLLKPSTTIEHTKTNAGRSLALNGHISEWRDIFFENAPQKLVADSDGEPVREVCIFPFPPNDVLVQGETKELCLYEERYVCNVQHRDRYRRRVAISITTSNKDGTKIISKQLPDAMEPINLGRCIDCIATLCAIYICATHLVL